MNCQDIANLLDEHDLLSLSPFQQEEFQRHIASCDDCASASRAARLLQRYGEMPTPMPEPGLMEATLRRTRDHAHGSTAKRSFWLGAGTGGAIAAGLVLGAILLLPVERPAPEVSAPSVTMALNEVRNVSVAIESAEALTDVTITVEMTGGIRLDRADGRRIATWQADLTAGLNRLTVPVAAVDGTDGDVRVELVHRGARKTFAVHIDIDEPDLDIEAPELAKNMEPIAAPSV